MLYKNELKISFTSEIRVRFTETDPMGIVWHGNYIQYFEDGREAFGREFGISYLEQKAHGYTSPIVRSVCEHKLPLRYGDVATIKTTFINSLAAKMIFQYQIFDPNERLACTGETIQVFLNEQGELSLTSPEFFDQWKTKMKI